MTDFNDKMTYDMPWPIFDIDIYLFSKFDSLHIFDFFGVFLDFPVKVVT